MSRDRYSTQVDPYVQRRVRAAVRGMRLVTGDDAWTLARFTEEALAAYAEHLQVRHNDGKPWPDPTGPLRPGRRLQSDTG